MVRNDTPERLSKAAELMTAFARRTGLIPGPSSEGRRKRSSEQRYLWTDAFAACNLLSLDRHAAGGPGQVSGASQEWRELALRLIDQVHHTLGTHRADDPREGWISGLDEPAGDEHPTQGGLRIGKPLPERQADELFDERLEWGRDGQYFHYLTKWMHALQRVSEFTQQPRFGVWARELARAAHHGFVQRRADGSPRQMFWKMSIDLSRPLVPSMGAHDPLDGLITCEQLAASTAGGPDLSDAIADFAALSTGREWATDDSLGLGGLLTDSWRLALLIERHGVHRKELLEELLEATRFGLKAHERTRSLERPARYRLGFRELGLSIGLHAAKPLRALVRGSDGPLAGLGPHVEALREHETLAGRIESFWLDEQTAGPRRGTSTATSTRSCWRRAWHRASI